LVSGMLLTVYTGPSKRPEIGLRRLVSPALYWPNALE
jgi:hypothetical protein